MSTTIAARASRQSAVLATIAGLHVGAIVLMAAGLRLQGRLDPAVDGPIFAMPPDPVPMTASPPDPLAGAVEFEAMQVERPQLNFAVDEEAGATAGFPLERTGEAAGGAAMVATAYHGPSLQTGDGRLVALINSCYPAAPRRLGQAGRGVARIEVDAIGHATGWSIGQSTGFPLLDAAMGCVARRLKFEPGRLDGRAVAATVQMPIVFRLN